MRCKCVTYKVGQEGVGWWVWLSCPQLSPRERAGRGSRKVIGVLLAGEDLFISLDHVVDCLDGDIPPWCAG